MVIVPPPWAPASRPGTPSEAAAPAVSAVRRKFRRSSRPRRSRRGGLTMVSSPFVELWRFDEFAVSCPGDRRPSSDAVSTCAGSCLLELLEHVLDGGGCEGGRRSRNAPSVRKLIPCSGRAVVVPQEPAQPLAATNVSAIARERFW